MPLEMKKIFKILMKNEKTLFYQNNCLEIVEKIIIRENCIQFNS